MNVQNFYPRAQQRVPEGRTTFRDPYGAPHLQLDRQDSQIRVQSAYYPEQNLSVRGSEDSVLLDYQMGHDFDVAFRKDGQNITVDRPGIYDDMNVRRDENSVTLDRPGPYNDVTVRFGENRIDVNTFDPTQRVSLQKQGEQVVVTQSGMLVESFPSKMFPGGWPAEPNLLSVSEYINMDARTAESLDRWSKDGIDKDDIVRVDRQGQVYTYESYYR